VSRGEVLRFGVVGAVAYGVDVAVFNALLLGASWPSPAAKVASSAVAVAVAFAGSRWWTWPDRRGDDVARESLAFVLVSVAAAGLQLLCLLASREVLGLRSALADNVSANVVGMAVATAFRFWAFRTVVFTGRRPVTGAGGGTPARAAPAARP
jgi:putative flippase GtrA